MTLQVIKTSDRSTTIYVSELDETYHSINGAVQESRHVFIKNGFRSWIGQNLNDTINILEVGFGTGLNALLSLLEANKFKVNISYTSLEPNPLPNEILDQLNYPEIIGDSNIAGVFKRIHQAIWDEFIDITSNFRLNKRNIHLEDFPSTGNSYDIIYFDAFAPGKQPEMWTIDMIRKTTSQLSERGVWVTYSAKGQLKRDLKSLGLTVETLPGPPGKNEMVRAIKSK